MKNSIDKIFIQFLNSVAVSMDHYKIRSDNEGGLYFTVNFLADMILYINKVLLYYGDVFISSL